LDRFPIRGVAAAEIDDLSAFATTAYAEAFGPSMSADDLAEQLRATRSVAYFRDAAKRDTILVATQADAIVGYIQLSDLRIPIAGASAADQELYALYVRGDRQRQGIGRALMEAAIAHPRFLRARRIYLDVWDENARALALYKRFGFRVVGRRDVSVGARTIGSDLVMMRPAVMMPLR